MSSRTLIDISRVAAEATWPSVATEVNGYLQNWIAAANAQVSQHQLRATTPNPNATASDPCGWRLEATLSQLTPGGKPAAVLLEVFITGTTFDILPGIGNTEPNLGSPGWGLDGRWVLPSHETLGSQGVWSAVPLPFTAQVGWSLESGQEYFVFAYTQYAYTNRQAVPLLIARDQVCGHWILAATPPSTSSSIYAGLRAVSWNARSGHPVGSRSLAALQAPWCAWRGCTGGPTTPMAASPGRHGSMRHRAPAGTGPQGARQQAKRQGGSLPPAPAHAAATGDSSNQSSVRAY